jgi:hypothetical protein
MAEQPAEGVVAGRTVRQIEEFPKEWLFGFGEQSHIDSALAATQDRAQSDEQKGVEIVQGGVSGPGIV